MDDQNPDRCYVGRPKCTCPPPSDVTSSSSGVAPVDWAVQDTIHYLSPASSPTTVYEGDLYEYERLRLFPYPPPGSLQLSSESTVSCEQPRIQRTLAIIKPEAMVYKDVVLKTIVDNGFAIVNERTLHLTPEQVAEVYEQHYGCPAFPNIVVSTSMGPLLVIAMDGICAVQKWKEMVGPYKTLHAEWFFPISCRNRFGLHVDKPDQLHASDNMSDATRENRYFYPQSVLEPMLCEEDKIEDYCNLYVNPTLIKGLVVLVKRKPADPIIFLAEWLLMNNPYKPSTQYAYAMAPT